MRVLEKWKIVSEMSEQQESGVVSETPREEKQERNKHSSKREERKESKKKSFPHRQHGVEKAFISGEPIFLLVYKEATLFANA